MSDDLIRDLSDWLLAAQPYRDDLVLVGGMVPWLYRAWAKPQGQPLFTTDVDVACGNRLPVRDRPLRECLAAYRLVQRIPTSPSCLASTARSRRARALLPPMSRRLYGVEGERPADRFVARVRDGSHPNG